MTKLFGTDGIRGIVNQDLSIELLNKIGKCLSLFKINKVIIGQDTRVSSPLLSFALISSCLSLGLNVYDEGVITTPCLSYLSEKLNSIGVMITASHNPFYYNGVKIFINGKKLTKEQEKLIENSIDNEFSLDNSIGLYKQSNLKYKYFTLLNKHKNKYHHLKIGLDCANGATSYLARNVYKTITNSLYIFNNLPNGYNINDNVGSTCIDTMVTYVDKHKLDIGFSYDGDGDRVIAVSKSGQVINGNLIIYILALYFFDYLGYSNRTIVLTKDSNLGVIESFNKIKVKVLLSDVGDSNVKQLMKENDVILGGEDSGHIISPYSQYGDGILTSLLLLNALHALDKNLDYFSDKLEIYPYVKYNISKYDKNILKEPSIIELIQQIKEAFSSYGVVLIRPSGTENLIRIYMCHQNKDILNKYNDLLENTLEMVGKKYER